MENYEIHIVAYTEIKKETKWHGNHIHFYNGVDNSHWAEAGVFIAISTKLKKK